MLGTRNGATRIEFAGLLATMILFWPLAGERFAYGQATAAADSMFRKLDASGDGVLSMDEATVGTRAFMDRVFKEAGKKPADRLSRDEFRAAYERLHAKPAASGGKSSSASSASGESAAAGTSAASAASRLVDENEDGSISKTEWSKFVQNFSRLDADKDGALDTAEMQAAGSAAELLMKVGDTNGDGKIVRLEWARLVKSFTRLDTNRDNVLDDAELRKAAETAAAAASGTASLPIGGKPGADKGPTLWRGRIQGRSEIELLIAGNRIEGREVGPGGDDLGAGTFTMTGDGKSGNLDAVYTEGSRAGQVCLGIYRIEGDSVQWCVNNRGARPQELTGGQGNWLLTLTRVDNASPSQKSK